MRLAITLALLALPSAALLAQEPERDRPDPGELRVSKTEQLGKFLFRTGLLSLDGSTSCASCHKEERFFADEGAESEGLLDLGGGRNTPSLVGLRHVRAFPGVVRSGASRAPLAPAALDLAERCLAPIENPLEMGSSVELGVRRLRELPGMKERFDEAFGPSTSGVTPRRIGEALAAFVRTFEVPETRFHRFLRGDRGALTALERRGYEAFQGSGCQACHSGPALSDGLVHAVMPPGAARAGSQLLRAQALARAAQQATREKEIRYPRQGLARPLYDAVISVPQSAGGCDGMGQTTRRGGYGGNTPGQTIEAQTLPLWNVTATAPYFRDGSAQDLEEAVRRHVEELRGVDERVDLVRKTLRDQGRRGLRVHTRLRGAMPDRLSPRVPRPVDDLEIKAIVAFLGALAPAPPRPARETASR